MRRRALTVPWLAALALLVPVTPAAAVSCDQELTDGQGLVWNTDYTAGLYSGGVQGYEYMNPIFGREFELEYEADDSVEDDCSLEDGGRELRYPAMTIGDLEVSPTIYVPSGEPAFTRHLVILHNPQGYPAALSPLVNADTEYGAGARVHSTSNGDQAGTAADDWMVMFNTNDNAVPSIGFVWNFGSADRRLTAPGMYDWSERYTVPLPPFDGDDNSPQLDFGRVVVPPGATVAVMAIGVHRSSRGEAESAVRSLQAAPEALLAGLSDDEKRGLLNVGLPDRDVDGLANGVDNCPDAVNADQANLDGDGQGDACDPDVDGDGLDGATEAARGTDPRAADSDGDGKRDDADACATRPGRGADGCPRFEEPLPPADVALPGVTIRRIGARMRLKAFRRGVPCAVDVSEAAAVACRLLVRARRVARVAAAGDLEVASRSLPLAAGGRRSARLRPKRGLIRQRRFRATLEVTATDAAGNRTTRTKRFRVRP